MENRAELPYRRGVLLYIKIAVTSYVTGAMTA